MSDGKLYCMEKPLFSKHCGYPCTKRSLWADVVLTRDCVSSSVGLAPLRTLEPKQLEFTRCRFREFGFCFKELAASLIPNIRLWLPKPEGWSPLKCARTKYSSKSCENRICANLALLVLWNRYLTLLAKNLSHTSPLGFCSSNWCYRGCKFFVTGSLAAPRPNPYVLFPVFVPCQIKILLVYGVKTSM